MRGNLILSELSDQQFVNWVRVKIGLRPILSGARSNPNRGEFDLGYIRIERLRRAADQNCTRCGGSGYYDSWHLDLICDCVSQPSESTP